MHRAVTAAVCAAVMAAMAFAPSWAAAAPGTVTDDTASDFQAGTPGGATEVVAPGSVRLAPAREDFDGDSLPAGFSSTPWTSGGAATVTGGQLTVDGALAAVDALGPAPRSLQFRAAFSAAPFENIGYGTTFQDGPWAMFSTGGGSLPFGLYARVQASAGGDPADFPIADVDPTITHTYRIDWSAAGISFYVDGSLVHTDPAEIASGMRPLVSDFQADGSAVTVDWMTRDTYRSSGTFDSRVLDAGDERATWGVLAAQGSADITFATRSGDTPTPDASWSDFAAVGPDGQITSPRGRYLQYRATLTTADPSATPTLDRVDATFDVDTVAPTATIGAVDVASASATVAFSSPDIDVARFECRLDDGDYAACTSPRQFAGLGDGQHTLAVRAVDNAGNVGGAVTREFTVDTTAPVASIDGLSVTGAAASVRFSSPDTDVARFECRLDDGDYAACASPKQFAGLGDGQHTVAVRAVDNAGNVGAAVTRDFTVDTTAPAASIDGVNVTGAAASVRFSSPDTDVARFECRLDDSDYAACTSPKQFAGLGDGQHTLAVRAVDGTGNVGAPVARDFTVDTTAPAAGIDKLDVARDTATVRFSSPDTDVARFECSLDHGDYAACASPKQFAGLGDGQHTVAVRAVDRTGNVGAASSVTFTIDTTAPASTVDGVNVTGATATVTFFSHDPDVARFECKVDDGEYASCTSPQQFRGLSDGRHTVAVRAVDGAGNTGVAQARDFAVDTTGPVVAIDGVQVAGTTATARFSSRDAGVVRFDCRLDGAAYAACTSPKRYAGLAVGTHTLAVRAVDATGNVGPAVARAFSVQAPPAGGGTPAPVADRTPPTVGLTPGTARVSRTGVVKLRVACSAGEVSCAVTVHLERGGRRIARGSTTVAGGRSRAISLRLRWAARRTLARRHRMKATATISARDAAGNSKTTTKTITLIAPRHVR